MTREEYEDFVLRYKGCGACFPMYHTLSRFEKMWFTAIQKDVADLEKENAELKGIKDVATLIRAKQRHSYYSYAIKQYASEQKPTTHQSKKR